jgi:hypothetical protein
MARVSKDGSKRDHDFMVRDAQDALLAMRQRKMCGCGEKNQAT